MNDYQCAHCGKQHASVCSCGKPLCKHCMLTEANHYRHVAATLAQMANGAFHALRHNMRTEALETLEAAILLGEHHLLLERARTEEDKDEDEVAVAKA